MNLSSFLELLNSSPDAGISLTLPDGSLAPAHFHITEIGANSKSFLDCGGKSHTEQTCVLQVWVADDYDHRIQAGKLAKIIDLASSLFENMDVPVEFEHEAPVLTRLPINSCEATDDTLNFHLTLKHADCLAKELCLPKRDFSLPDLPSLTR